MTKADNSGNVIDINDAIQQKLGLEEALAYIDKILAEHPDDQEMIDLMEMCRSTLLRDDVEI